MNEGVQVTDSWKYPTIQTAYEAPLTVPQVCDARNDPNDRLTCSFADSLDNEIAKAQLSFKNTQAYSNIKNNFEE